VLGGGGPIDETLWAPGSGPFAPPPSRGRGQVRPRSRLQGLSGQTPVSAKALAASLGAEHWRKITWREGVAEALAARFAALPIRPAHRDQKRSEPWPEAWLVIEWPEGGAEASKYGLANLPEDTALERIVHLAKLSWRIEHDERELKQELGLGHYEGHGWRGFDHHAAFYIAA
jgi:SRSO17 transposase